MLRAIPRPFTEGETEAIGEALDSCLLLLDFLGFWTLLPAPSMAYTNSPPPLRGFSGQIPGLPLLWQQQLTRPLLWGFPQGPCPERRQKAPALRD